MYDIKQHTHAQRLKLLDFIYSDVRDLTVDEIKQKMLCFYTTYNVIAANIAAATVYRVRKIEAGYTHALANDVWHPPADCVKKIGRANDIGESVFYCAFDPKTAIEEAQIEPGQRFSLATFQLTGHEDYKLGSVVVREGRLVPGREYANELNQFGVELSKFMVNEFTREVALSNEDGYKRSCAISKILFDLPNKDSIIYQSVKNLDAVNIALKSATASKRLKLLDVKTCCMDALQNIHLEAFSIPDVEGRLVQKTVPAPAPLKFTGKRPSFKELYSDKNIPSP
jgi:hypothetical protein